MKPIVNQSGQTLVILLIYMVIGIIVTTSSIALVINSSYNTDKVYQGNNALDVAESGAETAMIKLLRNPNYNGETLTINGGMAVITVVVITAVLLAAEILPAASTLRIAPYDPM